MNSNGYIYIRNHPSYYDENVCKIGKTKNIINRDSSYATGEITRGYFEDIYKVPIKQLKDIDILLHLWTFKTPTLTLKKYKNVKSILMVLLFLLLFGW